MSDKTDQSFDKLPKLPSADQRAHHNALERRRRDNIKDSFDSLQESVPSLYGERASRATVLKKAAEYIEFMRQKNKAYQDDIDELRTHNKTLEKQIQHLKSLRDKQARNQENEEEEISSDDESYRTE